MRFHMSGELSHQKRAICVCSGVREVGVVTPSPPSVCTSATSAAYRWLVSGYGGRGSNRCRLGRANGTTAPQPGAKANGWSGVKRYSPGAVPCGKEGSTSRVSLPSPARRATTAAAAAAPTSRPSAVARVGGSVWTAAA